MKERIVKYKKEIIIGALCAVALVGAVFLASGQAGNTNIKFESVGEKKYPHKISAEILPEYRQLERAMACIVDNQVYVIVTRGEKQTAGFEAKVTKLELKRVKDKNHLLVYASFIDPESTENLPQVATYPVDVVKAEIAGLPDTIELIYEYEDGK